MNEIAGLRARNRFSSFAPADFADAGEDVGDRLLLSVMMHARARFRRHLEQAAPDDRRYAERRRDGGATFRARRLRCSRIEFSRLTMWIAAEGFMVSRINFEAVTVKLSSGWLESH